MSLIMVSRIVTTLVFAAISYALTRKLALPKKGENEKWN